MISAAITANEAIATIAANAANAASTSLGTPSRSADPGYIKPYIIVTLCRMWNKRGAECGRC